MADVSILKSDVAALRAAVNSARVTSVELWRRAVFDQGVSVDEARAADQRHIDVRKALADTEKALRQAEAEEARRLEARVHDALPAGASHRSALARAMKARPERLSGALSALAARGEIVRLDSGRYGLATAPTALAS